MSNLYVTAADLTGSAIAQDSDTPVFWESLAESVSRMFDRECEVSDGFFAPAGNDTSIRSFEAIGTRYVRVDPYITDTIEVIEVDGDDVFESISSDRTYREKDGFLIFDSAIGEFVTVDVTARWGFEAVPADIKLACIEQALFMWRRKDLTFAEISGVSAAAVNASFSPTFSATTERYREKYGPNNFFS